MSRWGVLEVANAPTYAGPPTSNPGGLRAQMDSFGGFSNGNEEGVESQQTSSSNVFNTSNVENVSIYAEDGELSDSQADIDTATASTHATIVSDDETADGDSPEDHDSSDEESEIDPDEVDANEYHHTNHPMRQILSRWGELEPELQEDTDGNSDTSDEDGPPETAAPLTRQHVYAQADPNDPTGTQFVFTHFDGVNMDAYEPRHRRMIQLGKPHQITLCECFEPADKVQAQVQNYIQTDSCGICLFSCDEPVALVCGHVFCFDHIAAWVLHHDKCPLCKHGIDILESETKLVKVLKCENCEGRGDAAGPQSETDGSNACRTR